MDDLRCLLAEKSQSLVGDVAKLTDVAKYAMDFWRHWDFKCQIIGFEFLDVFLVIQI